MKISFIGSGATATTTAYAIGLNNKIDEIVLLDINVNIAKGKALDLEQSFILQDKKTTVIGTDDYENVKNSDVVIITAGVAGTADRETLLEKNKIIIKDIASKLLNVIPTDEKQPLIIVLTNPLDIILNHFIKTGNFNKKKTIGSGNWLDTSRFKFYLSKFLNINSQEIETYAIGEHGAKIIYLLSKTKINEKPLFEFIKEKNISLVDIEEVCKSATMGGAEILELLNKAGTTFGPAMSMNALFEAYIEKTKDKLLTASVYCNGEYGVNDFCFGCPIKLDKNGVKEIIEYKNLTENEKNKIEETKQFILELNLK